MVIETHMLQLLIFQLLAPSLMGTPERNRPDTPRNRLIHMALVPRISSVARLGSLDPHETFCSTSHCRLDHQLSDFSMTSRSPRRSAYKVGIPVAVASPRRTSGS